MQLCHVDPDLMQPPKWMMRMVFRVVIPWVHAEAKEVIQAAQQPDNSYRLRIESNPDLYCLLDDAFKRDCSIDAAPSETQHTLVSGDH